MPWAPMGAWMDTSCLGQGVSHAASPGCQDPQFVSQWVFQLLNLAAGGEGMWGAGCSPLHSSSCRGTRGAPEGSGGTRGSCCSPDPLPGSGPLFSPRADINSSVFPFPKFPR